MKIFVEPVYTARPTVCSTSFLVWKLIAELAAKHDDYFFYLTYPKKYEEDEEQMKFLQRMPDRVKLFPMHYQTHDRTEELFKTSTEMVAMLEPGITPIWDFDIMLTSRIPQIPFMRAHTNREVSFNKGTYRGFIGLEEMPVFSFRDSVSWGNGGRMDLNSFGAYLNSDGIVVNNLYTGAEISKLAREWLSPSRTISLMKNIKEAVPVRLERLADNPKPVKKEVTVAFTGRITGTRNFGQIATLFRQHAAMPLGKNGIKTNFVASTHSLSTGSIATGEIDFIEMRHNNREQFHAFLQNEAHVVVTLSTTEDFSLSTYEPLLYGVPVIVPDRKWASFLGDDYPFIAADHKAAYALVKEFITNYDEMYAKFRAWEERTWKKLVDGPRNRTTTEAVEELIDAHEARADDWLINSDGGDFYRKIIARVSKAKGKVIDVMAEAQKDGQTFVCPNESWRHVPVGRRPNMYLFKRYLKLAGWTDTLEPGVMRKPA